MELGLSEARFWRLTAREFRALADRVTERERREDGRVGVVATILANANRDSKRQPQPFQPADFFPSLSEATRPAPRRTEASPEEIAAGWELWASLCGAKVS